jgi:acetyl esterase/lipase
MRTAAFLAVAGVLGLSPAASAQTKIIPVWPQGAPGSASVTHKEVETTNERSQKMFRNVTEPTLTAYLPDSSRANGTAVIVCPGGGFRVLMWDYEGTDVAKWLNERGIAAFVLKYRLRDTGTDEEYRKATQEAARKTATADTSKAASGASRPPVPEAVRKVMALAIADGQQAVKVVRQHAAEWGIAPDRVGIMGFSAGAVVTLGVALDHDADSRPSFAAPIYGGGSGDIKVPRDAPPLFLAVAADDRRAATGSVRVYSEWTAADRPVELHIYSKGGHGFGMKKQNLPVDHWIDRFGDWLQLQGWLDPASKSPTRN